MSAAVCRMPAVASEVSVVSSQRQSHLRIHLFMFTCRPHATLKDVIFLRGGGRGAAMLHMPGEFWAPSYRVGTAGRGRC